MNAVDLAAELAQAAKTEFATLGGTPWEEARGRVVEALRHLLLKRFPELPRSRIDTLAERFVIVSDVGIRIGFNELAEAALLGDVPASTEA